MDSAEGSTQAETSGGRYHEQDEGRSVAQAKVSITSLAHGGSGVGRLPDGRAVFVPQTCPGDEALVEVAETHDRWATAHVVELLVASSRRVEPRCPYFGSCGGCQWQHVAYETQTEAKRTALLEVLRRIGRLEEPDVAQTVCSPAQYGYRNKVELAVGTGATGPVVGFTRSGSEELVPVDACLLLPEGYSGITGALGGAVRFLWSRGATGLTRLSVRVSRAGEVAVDLWTTPGAFPRKAAAKVIADATGARNVSRVIARGAPERRDVVQVEVLAGRGAWRETLGGDTFLVSPPSFFQVNTAAAARLREVALHMASLDGSMRAADLYAGVGTFTLPVARAAGSVVAVEASRWALRDLRRNLDAAGLTVEVVPGDAARVLGALGHLDALLVDPPRSGLSDRSIEACEQTHASRLVYVSCDPATLARDAARLARAGFAARRFVPVDLFPQTYHLETVALFERV